LSQHVRVQIDNFIKQAEKQLVKEPERSYGPFGPADLWEWADSLLRGARLYAAADELGKKPRGMNGVDIQDMLERLRRALLHVPDGRRGRPGRPRAYSQEALDFAFGLRAQNPTMKLAVVRARCAKQFGREKVPAADAPFRSWLSRGRRKQKRT
jgi:hypothetical protein